MPLANSIFNPAHVKGPENPLSLATIGAWSSGVGATLIFDGQTAATAKRYKRLSTYTPTAGDRVLVAKISGSYVILGKISL